MADSTVRVAIVGAGGRMGRQLIQAAQEQDGIQLGAAIEREGSSLIGIDAGELAGIGQIGVKVVGHLDSVVNDFDVLIDFTRPEGTLQYLAFCQSHQKAWSLEPQGLMNKENWLLLKPQNLSQLSSLLTLALV